VAGCPQELGGIHRHILIQLTAHQAAGSSGRQRNHAFLR
jgi:hypothetical protein